MIVEDERDEYAVEPFDSNDYLTDPRRAVIYERPKKDDRVTYVRGASPVTVSAIPALYTGC